MPISLPPISRRLFLAGSVATAVGVLLRRSAPAAPPEINPHRFALLSDSHINADPKTISRDANMTDHFLQVRSELLALTLRPAAVLIDGDLAHNSGEAGDYAALVDLLRPLREHGLPIHLTLGNHDNRERFWDALPAGGETKQTMKDRQAMVLPSDRANWFILDSLDQTNSTPGLCGSEQLTWLGKALDAQTDKPALVVVHHDVERGIVEKKPGLQDSAALLEIVRPRKHVKAVFFGHTHTWDVRNADGLHLINFPPVAYVFTPGYPSGWIDAHLGKSGMTIELRSIDSKHPKHGEKIELNWRT